MTLHLAVPAPDQNANLTVETRPPQVSEWLESLPLSNLSEAARALSDALNALNRSKINEETRLKLLELYRSTIHRLLPALEAQFSGLPLPLPEKARQIANQTRQLQVELANGYKLILLDYINHRAGFGTDRLLPLVVERALASLSRILTVCYQTYAPTPAGVWSEIHQLFRYAAQEKIQDEPVADMGRQSSISLAYKQILLLTLVDPYRLMQGEAGKVMEYLTHFGSHAQLQPLAQTSNPAALFLVRLDSDKPPKALAHNAAITDARTDILLNTIELARMLHHQILRLETGDSPKSLFLPDDAKDPAYQGMLRRMLKHWGVAPKRIFKRTLKEAGMGVHADSRMEICSGIRTIYYFLNGKKPFVPPELAKKAEENEITLQFPTAALEAGSQRTFTTSEWAIVNESAGGLAIRKASTAPTDTTVGEVIGLHAKQTGTWNIGVVRWVHSENPDHLEMGTQMLAPRASPAAIKPVIASAAAVFQAALLLPEIPSLKQPASIVAPRGTFQPQREFHLLQDGSTQAIRATKLVEQTTSFDLFEFGLS
ncbi:MAG: hypothetical protein AB1710_00280 [Pseudomonadota bacterium]|jgi:hypothetical protein